MKDYLFTSESVSDGHPDKMADQISDAVLDEALQKAGGDADSVRCACEVLLKSQELIVAGELTPKMSDANVKKIADKVIERIGYTEHSLGFGLSQWNLQNLMEKQQEEVRDAVNIEEDGTELGAGDQGQMFGYACSETSEFMPLAISISHALMRQHKEVREDHGLRPDAKAQVTVRYTDGFPSRIEKVVLSTQHGRKMSQDMVVQAVRDVIITPVMQQCSHSFAEHNNRELEAGPELLINPSGSFVVGGPEADAGLTGRKIIVDTYGGSAPHGGGAFSGKDPTKVDRSAAYMARYIAKTVVRHGLARRCLVQLSYAIGVAQPLSVMVNAYDDGEGVGCKIQEAVRECLDLSVSGIIRKFALFQPKGWNYVETAAFGHFGREQFPWEQVIPGCAFDKWCQGQVED